MPAIGSREPIAGRWIHLPCHFLSRARRAQTGTDTARCWLSTTTESRSARSATTTGLSIRAAWRPTRSGACSSSTAPNACWRSNSVGKVVRDSGVIAGLNPGGGTFGPDGRYYVGLRDARTVLALPPNLRTSGEYVLPSGIVPFPRGFGFNTEGKLFLSSGVGPDGKGDDTIVAFSGDRTRAVRLVDDPELSPLDLTWRRTATWWCRVSARSERSTRSPRSANTILRAGGLCACSPPHALRRFAGRVVCALAPTVISTAPLRTRLSRSTSRLVAVSAPSLDWPG